MSWLPVSSFRTKVFHLPLPSISTPHKYRMWNLVFAVFTTPITFSPIYPISSGASLLAKYEFAQTILCVPAHGSTNLLKTAVPCRIGPSYARSPSSFAAETSFKSNIIPLCPHAVFWISHPCSVWFAINGNKVRKSNIHPATTNSIPLGYGLINTHHFRKCNGLQPVFVKCMNKILHQSPPKMRRSHIALLQRLLAELNVRKERKEAIPAHTRFVTKVRCRDVWILGTLLPQVPFLSKFKPRNEYENTEKLQYFPSVVFVFFVWHRARFVRRTMMPGCSSGNMIMKQSIIFLSVPKLFSVIFAPVLVFTPHARRATRPPMGAVTSSVCHSVQCAIICSRFRVPSRENGDIPAFCWRFEAQGDVSVALLCAVGCLGGTSLGGVWNNSCIWRLMPSSWSHDCVRTIVFGVGNSLAAILPRKADPLFLFAMCSIIHFTAPGPVHFFLFAMYSVWHCRAPLSHVYTCTFVQGPFPEGTLGGPHPCDRYHSV